MEVIYPSMAASYHSIIQQRFAWDQEAQEIPIDTYGGHHLPTPSTTHSITRHVSEWGM